MTIAVCARDLRGGHPGEGSATVGEYPHAQAQGKPAESGDPKDGHSPNGGGALTISTYHERHCLSRLVCPCYYLIKFHQFANI